MAFYAISLEMTDGIRISINDPMLAAIFGGALAGFSTGIYLSLGYYHGSQGADTAWAKESDVKFLAIVPGYDRHFTICEEFGIKLINVDIKDDGPDIFLHKNQSDFVQF